MRSPQGVGAHSPIRPFKFYTPPPQNGHIPVANILTLSASMQTFSGSLAKQTGFVISAAFGSTGSFAKQVGFGLSAAFGFAGSLVRQTGVGLQAAFGFAGSLVKQAGANLLATSGFSGTAGKQIGTVFNAVSSFSASLAKQTNAVLAAVSIFSGSLTRQVGSSLRAALGMSASTARQIGAVLNAVVGFAGLVGKQTNKVFVATMVAFNGLLSQVLVFVVAIAASMQAFAGVISRQTKTSRSVNLGFLASVSKMTGAAMSASMSFSGTVGRQTSRFLNAISSVWSAIVAGVKQSTPVPPVPPSFQPIIIGRMVASSGLSVSNSAEIDRFSSSTQIFSGPSTPFARGQRAMAGQLLFAPGNGSLSGRTYQAVMGGIATIPASASNTSLIITLFQNYFLNGVLVQSDPLSVVSVPIVAGQSTLWSMVCELQGNGRGNGILIANASSAPRYSNFNPFVEPKIMLSVGVNLSGSASDTPQVRMMQFDLQEK